MRKAPRLRTLALIGVISSSILEFKAYPSVRSEPWADSYKKEAQAALRQSSPTAELDMWITDDSYEKVRDFYRTLGIERPEFARPLTEMLSARSGRKVQATYVIFDGADSPVTSKDYVSVQRPVVPRFDPLEVRDVTAIARYRLREKR